MFCDLHDFTTVCLSVLASAHRFPVLFSGSDGRIQIFSRSCHNAFYGITPDIKSSGRITSVLMSTTLLNNMGKDKRTMRIISENPFISDTERHRFIFEAINPFDGGTSKFFFTQ